MGFRRIAVLAAVFAVAIGSVFTGPAHAADGDQLASFDASSTASIPGCSSGVGTGIAFDGTSLILSCWYSNILERVDPLTHANNGAISIAGVADIRAIAYDGTRDRMWACSSDSLVTLIDLNTHAVDPAFTPFPVAGCTDGLAYDGADDTIWASPDVSSVDYHYSTAGGLLASLSNGGKLGSCANSGIAVGGDKLYLANNGCSEIYQVSKDMTTSTKLATFPRRIEDLECDEMTFAPKAAIWSVDAYDRILNAWEIPAGSCSHGGGVKPCTDVVVGVTRPIGGHAYVNDVDNGPTSSGQTTVGGTPLTVDVSATAPGLVDHIDIYLDGVLEGTDTTSPYSVTFDPAVSPGNHMITARATHIGSASCTAQSKLPVSIDCPVMGLLITRPLAARLYVDDVDTGLSGSADIVVKGTPLTVTADATGASGLDFYLDGSLQGTDTTAPYSWTIGTDVGPGTHALRVIAHSPSSPDCTERSDRTFRLDCFTPVLGVTRPQNGRAYLNDIDIGPAPAEARSYGGNLTARATTSDPSHTASIEFSLDGDTPVIDSVAPYEATFDTQPIAIGLHSISAKVIEPNALCFGLTTVGFLRVDDSIKGVARGVSVTSNVPAQPVVQAGGATVDRSGGTHRVRVVDRALPPVVDNAHVVTDTATGSLTPNLLADSDSLVTDVSLLGGVITADALHAHARATYTLATAVSTASANGSQIANLRINGMPVPAEAENTVVAVPGAGRVVLHEVLTTRQDGRTEITVNMLHAFIDNGLFKGEVVLGSAHAGVNADGDVFFGPENDLIHKPDDAGTHTDAGADAAHAINLQPGLYSGGMLTSIDTSDFYRFQAGQGDRIIGVLKPAERETVRINPGPAGSTVTEQPNLDLYLYDPSGVERASSSLSFAPATSGVERVEINADTPFAPADAKGPWTLEVRRADALDGFYTLELSLLPVVLRAQNDADLPGDAPDSCDAARVLPPSATNAQEIDNNAFAGVIRDADQADYYKIQAKIGQLISIVMKPDELDDGADFDLELYGPSAPGGDANCAYALQTSTLGKPIIPKGSPDVIVQLPAQMTGSYVFGVRRFNAVGNYYVNANVTNPLPTMANNDASTGTDASNACASATAIAAGAYQGRFDDIGGLDDDDWYSVSLAAGQDITAVLKPSDPSDFDLELYKPDCSMVNADRLTQNHLPLSAPETVHAQDTPGGIYKIHIHRQTSGGNYMLTVLSSP